MNTLDFKLLILILIPLLLLGGIGFFFYWMYTEIKATQAMIDQQFRLATSTDPLIMLGQGVVTGVAQLNMHLIQQVKTPPPFGADHSRWPQSMPETRAGRI